MESFASPGAVVLLFVVLPFSRAQGDVRRFEPSAGPTDVPHDPSIDRGWLVVSEDHSAPGGPTIRMPTIIHGRSDDPAPDPVVFTMGGPGAASLWTVGWSWPASMIV